jgi:hypothetical protein
MSPVWIMKEGLAGSDLIFAIASSSVPITLGLAGLSKPTWLSLICRKLILLGSAASAVSMIPSERGIPPEMVHSTPVPAQVMHSSTFLRFTPIVPLPCVALLMTVLHLENEEDREPPRSIPTSRKCEPIAGLAVA